jgi:serine-type D-Ala-D-Ala carboxypeptidase/endopeptidase
MIVALLLALAVAAMAATATAAPSPSAAPTPSPAPSGIEPVNLDDYIGSYDSDQGLSFVVTHSGSQLIVQLIGQPAVPVYESAKDEFYYKVVDAQLDFVRGSDGKVEQLILHQNGITITAARPGAALPHSSFPPVVALDSATLDSYVGTYVASPVAAFTVMRDGDQILIQLTGQPAVPVFPSAKDEFYYKIVDAKVTFVRDANGKITQLILHQNGRDISAVRS